VIVFSSILRSKFYHSFWRETSRPSHFPTIVGLNKSPRIAKKREISPAALSEIQQIGFYFIERAKTHREKVCADFRPGASLICFQRRKL